MQRTIILIVVELGVGGKMQPDSDSAGFRMSAGFKAGFLGAEESGNVQTFAGFANACTDVCADFCDGVSLRHHAPHCGAASAACTALRSSSQVSSTLHWLSKAKAHWTEAPSFNLVSNRQQCLLASGCLVEVCLATASQVATLCAE